MSATKWTQLGTNAYGDHFHFFASSVARWQTSSDLDALIRTMKKDGYAFNLFKVHLHEGDAYPIKSFQPDVPEEKLDFIAFFEPTT